MDLSEKVMRHKARRHDRGRRMGDCGWNRVCYRAVDWLGWTELDLQPHHGEGAGTRSSTTSINPYGAWLQRGHGLATWSGSTSPATAMDGSGTRVTHQAGFVIHGAIHARAARRALHHPYRTPPPAASVVLQGRTACGRRLLQRRSCTARVAYARLRRASRTDAEEQSRLVKSPARSRC